MLCGCELGGVLGFARRGRSLARVRPSYGTSHEGGGPRLNLRALRQRVAPRSRVSHAALRRACTCGAACRGRPCSLSSDVGATALPAAARPAVLSAAHAATRCHPPPPSLVVLSLTLRVSCRLPWGARHAATAVRGARYAAAGAVAWRSSTAGLSASAAASEHVRLRRQDIAAGGRRPDARRARDVRRATQVRATRAAEQLRRLRAAKPCARFHALPSDRLP